MTSEKEVFLKVSKNRYFNRKDISTLDMLILSQFFISFSSILIAPILYFIIGWFLYQCFIKLLFIDRDFRKGAEWVP